MNRAVSPVFGTLLLTVLAVALAAVAGVIATDYVPDSEPPAPVELSASANATSDRLVVVHESGPALDVRRIDVRVAVDGTRLEHQPPVPFSGASGFRGAPTGPFNDATDPTWEVGERAGLRIAGTNYPELTPGVSVTVELYREDLRLARVEVTAR